MTVSKLDWLKNLRGIGRNELSWREYRVLMSVFDYSSGDGTSAHPGAARIAEDTCISERIVRDCLKSLVEKQWLLREERGGQKEGVRRAASFQLHPEPAPYLTPARSEQAHSEHPARSEPAHSTPSPLPAASSPPGHTHQVSFIREEEEETLEKVDTSTGEIVSDLDSRLDRAWNDAEALIVVGTELPDDHPRKQPARDRYRELTARPESEAPKSEEPDLTPEIFRVLRERNAA